ncbi:hypothetical protein AURDEDRAFT_178550, partial [Auricularia subglabra TFB-10046 SS5]
MAAPDWTYDLLPADWTEDSFDWRNHGYRGQAPIPLIEDIDWSKIKRNALLRVGGGSGRIVPPVEPDTVFTPMTLANTCRFGTYECAIATGSRDILFDQLRRRGDKFEPRHHNQEARGNPVGWALVPCVSMRLCTVNGQLHVYAVRLARDCWGDIKKFEKERYPDPGEQVDDPSMLHTTFVSKHPGILKEPRALLVPVAPWLRRPLQILFHTDAYLWYARVYRWGNLYKGDLQLRRREMYYHELVSNFFTELTEISALSVLGQNYSAGFYPSTLLAHLIREYCQKREFPHTEHGSSELLSVTPLAYRTDASLLNWDSYYERTKLLWAYTMGCWSNVFSCWRAHRGLCLDLLTSYYMLNWKTHHISWDMDFIRRHRGAPLVQWCIVPVKKKPWFFDVRDLDIPSTLYPRAEYSDESEDDSSSSSSEDNRRKRKGNAKSDDEGVLRLAEISDADEFLADENDIYDTIRHYPLADPQ